MTAAIPDQRADPDAAAAAESWQLVERAQAGDMDAFADLYRRYHDTVFRFIYFRVGGRPLAEDLAGDVWVRALKNLGRIEWQGRDIGAWLVTVARNRVADHFKSGLYRLEISTGDVLDENLVDRDDPEMAAVDHLTNVELLAAVQKLGDEQRDCLVYRFLQGLSVNETAEAMGKNVGAIKALQYRAMRSLHRLLPAEFVEANR